MTRRSFLGMVSGLLTFLGLRAQPSAAQPVDLTFLGPPPVDWCLGPGVEVLALYAQCLHCGARGEVKTNRMSQMYWREGYEPVRTHGWKLIQDFHPINRHYLHADEGRVFIGQTYLCDTCWGKPELRAQYRDPARKPIPVVYGDMSELITPIGPLDEIMILNPLMEGLPLRRL